MTEEEWMPTQEFICRGERTPKGVAIKFDKVYGEVVRCKDCKHYKQSNVADRKMCFRKDADGVPVCYDFLPDDWCKYGERKEDE